MPVIIENLQNEIEITDKATSLLTKAVEISLQKEGFELPSEISILLVGDEQIKEINKEQRKIDKPTDVLSFPIVDMIDGKIISNEGDFDLEEEVILLGDIVISLETAVRQAEDYGHSFERELAFLVTHGTFHLLGYDHPDQEQEKRMIDKQEEVLTQLGLKR
ncbi:MAG: rRNA maturation RNase YbeY [Clostridiales bacterium]|jgi:probable rRNA maturation factor|nr:rRNA maturation RNase YbeY [Clostridiales bacterium]